jgi:thiamine-phosphate pyrophosphorylase
LARPGPTRAAPGGGDLARAARRCRPARRRGCVLPTLWLVSDPARLPDPRPIAARLPRGAGILARGVARDVLAGLVAIARRRGLVLLVAGDGRAARGLGAGLHLPERRGAAGLLPFLVARRGGAPGALLSLAAHGGARGAARARRLRPDLLFLSPIFPTASHPGAPALGPLRWLAAARGLRPVPAVALGGIAAWTARRVPPGAAGIAAIGGLLPQAVAAPPHCLR